MPSSEALAHEGVEPAGDGRGLLSEAEELIASVVVSEAPGSLTGRNLPVATLDAILHRPDHQDMSPKKLYLCFGVGFGNFGMGREWRMADLVKAFGDRDPEHMDVIAWYGSTGNVAVRGQRPTDVRSVLRDVSCRAWAVVDRGKVMRGLDALNRWDPLEPPPQTRWTGGLAFAVSGDRGGSVANNERAKLRRLERGLVAVYKNDAVTDADRLDRNQRRGGWGAISLDVSRQVEGRWTARSRRTIEGLLDRVERS